MKPVRVTLKQGMKAATVDDHGNAVDIEANAGVTILDEDRLSSLGWTLNEKQEKEVERLARVQMKKEKDGGAYKVLNNILKIRFPKLSKKGRVAAAYRIRGRIESKPSC